MESNIEKQDIAGYLKDLDKRLPSGCGFRRHRSSAPSKAWPVWQSSTFATVAADGIPGATVILSFAQGLRQDFAKVTLEVLPSAAVND